MGSGDVGFEHGGRFDELGAGEILLGIYSRRAPWFPGKERYEETKGGNEKGRARGMP